VSFNDANSNTNANDGFHAVAMLVEVLFGWHCADYKARLASHTQRYERPINIS